VEIGLRRVGASLGGRDEVEAAHVGERGCQKRRPGVGGNVVGNSVVQPDEGDGSFFDFGSRSGSRHDSARILELARLGSWERKVGVRANSDEVHGGRGHNVETAMRDDVLSEMGAKLVAGSPHLRAGEHTSGDLQEESRGPPTRNERDHARDLGAIACCNRRRRAVGESSSRKPARESRCRIRLLEKFQDRVDRGCHVQFGYDSRAVWFVAEIGKGSSGRF
jgi:hypothetical protein